MRPALIRVLSALAPWLLMAAAWACCWSIMWLAFGPPESELRRALSSGALTAILALLVAFGAAVSKDPEKRGL
jgi:hypothetical protein